MTITRLSGANAITGTLPATNINDTSIGNITALPAGVGGKVLQVVNATSTTEVVESGSSFTDTGLSATITPSSSSNKILISANIQGVGKNGDGFVTLKLLRGSTDIVANFENRGGDTDTSSTNKVGGCSVTYLDSPSTTSATTYKVQMKGNGNSYAQTGDSNPNHTITLIEVAG